jgi:hypothetical protein
MPTWGVALANVSERPYVSPVGFTKLFSSLIFSTVWREEMHVKVVWITMLAMANRNGEVWASVPGLADAAKVSVDQCRHALERLSAPDPDSRTKDHEGRRINAVDGGWAILNYPKYRELRDSDERRLANREYQRRHRKKASASNVTVSKRQPSKPPSAQAEAEAEAEAEKETASRDKRGRPTWLTPFGDAWKSRYGGEPAYKRLGKALKPLCATNTPDVVLRHWTYYLDQTEAEYASPERFAATFGRWSPDQVAPPSVRPDPRLAGSVAEYAEQLRREAGA